MAEDDDWSEISSVGEGPKGSDSSIDAESKAKSLSNIPSIFSTTLPPCGLHPQCAFENVNERLRKLWIEKSRDPAVTVSILDICKKVHEELWLEDYEYPHGSLLFTKSRQPWRLESVFRYEILWSQWFIREAEIQEDLPQMTEAERRTHRSSLRLNPVPSELRLFTRNKPIKWGLKKQWSTWRHDKRGIEEPTRWTWD